MTSLDSTIPPPVTSINVPNCAVGFIWILELSTCLPELKPEFSVQPRSYPINNGCPVGYYLNVRFRQCIRRKYHAQQEEGRIKKWWNYQHNPKQSQQWYPTYRPKTTAYTGKWYAYGARWGDGVTRGR